MNSGARTHRRYAPWLAAAAISLLFALTRLLDLTRQALHYDEASFIWWGQVAAEDWNQRFVGAMWGGRQPLHSWTISWVYHLFPDPLLAGRLAAGLAGAFAAAGLFLLARRLFGTRTALLAVLLYTLCPFALLYDRHALTDSLCTAEGVWIAYLALELLLSPRILGAAALAAALALAFGATMLSRSLVPQFAAFVPFALLAAPREALTRGRLLRWAAGVALALGAGWLVYYGAFGYAPISDNVRIWETVKFHHLLGLSDLLQFPVAVWQSNLVKVAGWLSGRLTWPLLLAIGAAVLSLPWLPRKSWYVAAWGVLPTLGVLLFASHPYERYLLYGIPALLLLLAYAGERGAAWLWARRRPAALAAGSLAALALLPALALDMELITGIDAEPHSSGEYYFFGLYGARDYLAAEAAGHPIDVIVDSPLTPVSDGLAALLHNTPGVRLLRVRGNPVRFYEPSDGATAGVDVAPDAFAGRDVYYAAWSTTVELSDIAPRLQMLLSFANNGEPASYVGLYRVSHFYQTELSGRLHALARPGDAVVFLRQHTGDALLDDLQDLQLVPLGANPEQELALLAASPRRLFVLYWDSDPADDQQAIDAWLSTRGFKGGDDWYASVRLATYRTAASYAPERTLDARAGSALRLNSYSLPDGPVRPGDIIAIRLMWEPQAPLATAYKVFVHLVDSQGRLAGQNDLPLVDDATRATGGVRCHQHGLLIPPGTAPGIYHLRAGVYPAEGGARLPMQLPGGPAAEWVDLGEIEVVAP